jgi:hypothetical protein
VAEIATASLVAAAAGLIFVGGALLISADWVQWPVAGLGSLFLLFAVGYAPWAIRQNRRWERIEATGIRTAGDVVESHTYWLQAGWGPVDAGWPEQQATVRYRYLAGANEWFGTFTDEAGRWLEGDKVSVAYDRSIPPPTSACLPSIRHWAGLGGSRRPTIPSREARPRPSGLAVARVGVGSRP